MEIRRYRRDAAYSYTLGTTLTIELIRQKREYVRAVYVHPDYRTEEERSIFEICGEAGIPCERGRKVFNRLAAKGNTYVIGVFEKFPTSLERDTSHVVLVNPGDAGNLGTILRTGLGFGFRDYAVVRPGVDFYDPRTVRASMGALFHVRCSYYDSFDCYRECFPAHEIYSFLLDGERELDALRGRRREPFSLVFGNEGTGLPDSFHGYGESIRISHSREIDSLNLAVAFGIAANAFARLQGAESNTAE